MKGADFTFLVEITNCAPGKPRGIMLPTHGASTMGTSEKARLRHLQQTSRLIQQDQCLRFERRQVAKAKVRVALRLEKASWTGSVKLCSFFLISRRG